MDDTKVRTNLDSHVAMRKEYPSMLKPAFEFFGQIPHKLPSCLKTHIKRLVKNDQISDTAKPLWHTEKDSYTAYETSFDKQLQAWKENPYWVDQPPEIKVTVPKGSLCNLNAKFKVGLPPDAIYNIVIDPENKRVFKNIKEVISRRVLVDEGLRQIVEVEQAAIWRFLWWSGTISVHVIVDQNRKDHTVKYKQGKSGFMKRFEGSWKIDPLFVDEQICHPHKPKMWVDYDTCTGGKGRVGSIVTLDQLVQPALVPPPPISWYLRGITTRTTEMLISDLLAEAARQRGVISYIDSQREKIGDADSRQERGANGQNGPFCSSYSDDIKGRWRRRRSKRKQRTNRSLLEH